ncbi:hypothetical protein PENSTE_c003G07161 [Penicillium steckii]|uniref:Uncharacterized protein n=1 Tax=Penicillium steckii TaxID=303698 RepID=A0A1V6TRK7_9EURO|nr:hypothetical protein PENSTE_c003G07161 [Penicillium steckii]
MTGENWTRGTVYQSPSPFKQPRGDDRRCRRGQAQGLAGRSDNHQTLVPTAKAATQGFQVSKSMWASPEAEKTNNKKNVTTSLKATAALSTPGKIEIPSASGLSESRSVYLSIKTSKSKDSTPTSSVVTLASSTPVKVEYSTNPVLPTSESFRELLHPQPFPFEIRTDMENSEEGELCTPHSRSSAAFEDTSASRPDGLMGSSTSNDMVESLGALNLTDDKRSEKPSSSSTYKTRENSGRSNVKDNKSPHNQPSNVIKSISPSDGYGTDESVRHVHQQCQDLEER